MITNTFIGQFSAENFNDVDKNPLSYGSNQYTSIVLRISKKIKHQIQPPMLFFYISYP
jgi:hypothetical protein